MQFKANSHDVIIINVYICVLAIVLILQVLNCLSIYVHMKRVFVQKFAVPNFVDFAITNLFAKCDQVCQPCPRIKLPSFFNFAVP